MLFAPATRIRDRIAALRERFDPAGVSALLVTHPANVFYLSNFRGSAGMLLVAAEDATLVVDARYATAAAALLEGSGGCPDLDLALVASSYEQTIVARVGQRDASPGGHRLGIESAHMTVAQHQWFMDAFVGSTVTLRPTSGLVEEARSVKDADEASILRDAGRRISSVMADALQGLRPGLSEREVAADIDRAIVRAGFDRPAFETIVAAGSNTALPHARPGSRVLESDDLVLLDFGGSLDGYCVDLTRVASLGPPDDDAREWHAAVRAAHAAALAVVRPGVAAVEVDAAARREIAERGLAQAFTHGTGHGLGIEVHEAPRIGKRREPSDTLADTPLRAGMVFTVEPGVYLPSRGGIRLEDDVLVTRIGYELLTDVPLDLHVVSGG